MISVQFVNKAVSVKENSSLADLLWQNNFNNKGCAVVLNNQFIPREQHATTLLQNDDCIEVMVPMQGG